MCYALALNSDSHHWYMIMEGIQDIDQAKAEYQKQVETIDKANEYIKQAQSSADEARKKIQEHCYLLKIPTKDCVGAEQYERLFPLGEKKNPKVTKVGWTEEQSYWHQYIYEKSGYKKECVIIKEAENGRGDWQRRHDPAKNSKGVDWGLCGINDYYHPEIVNDPRFLTDQSWQADKCVEFCLSFLETGSPKFYGYIDKTRRQAAMNNLIFE